MRQVIIPARGGSKGVPRKNVRCLYGESLIRRCVRTCVQADVDRVVVSTEDDEIASLASAAGAIVCWRPAELATDTAKGNDAVAHAVGKFPCDVLALCQCTSPLLTVADVNGTLAALTAGVDLAICCIPFHGLICDEAGPLNYQADQSPNRQQRQPQWLVSGHAWAMRPAYLMQPWMSGKLAFHRATCQHPLEIDTEADWALAELLLFPYAIHAEDYASPASQL